ncbi:hypothetical protein H4219_001829 [Mycoemilia scoparia]|uniref:Uncharacterized protein n=1 Tax=Mycoemilia scoparia TaxID=417184 RepID=A0A9W7ZZD5_9FUNG|nr:hypothetical protein H4219_001829 [Mycoemilia scoparia]
MMWDRYQLHDDHPDHLSDFSDGFKRTPSPTYRYSFQAEQTSSGSAKRRTEAKIMDPHAMLHFLNREIVSYGLPGPLRLPEHDEYLEDNQRIVECLSALLVQKQKDTEFRQDMDDEMRKAMGEEEANNFKISQLKKQLELSQREAAELNSKVASLQKANNQLNSEKKKALSELRTVKANYESTKIHKLKERIQKAIGEKSRNAKISFELLNPPARSSPSSPASNIGTERQLINELLNKYEDNEKRILSELENYKKMVRNLSRSIRQLVPTQSAAADSLDISDGGNTDELSMDEQEIAKLEKSTLTVIEMLSKHIEELKLSMNDRADPEEIVTRDNIISELEEEIERLKKEIDDLKSQLEGKERVLDIVSSTDFIKGTSDNAFNTSISEMTLEELEAERKALNAEKQQLEEERKRFTEAAIELGNERSLLKKERDEFETRKSGAATGKLLDGLPETPQWLKDADINQATPQLYSKLQDMMLATPLGALYTAQMNTLLRQQQHLQMAAGQSMSPLPNNASAAIGLEPQDHATPLWNKKIAGDKDAAASPDVQENGPTKPLAEDITNKLRETTIAENMKRTPTTRGLAPHLETAERARATHTRQQGTPPSPHSPPQTRTPTEIRQSRGPRMCTRPGCAAHTPHSHDGSPDASGRRPMELKPPVPKFRKAPNSTAASPSAKKPLPSRELRSKGSMAKITPEDKQPGTRLRPSSRMR